MSASPLDLKEHLRLRKALSTVSRSSLRNLWKAAPEGAKLDCLIRFLKLRFGPGKLSSDEFIQYGFCNPDISYEEQKRFAGKQAQQAFNLIYNDKTWYAATKHKLFFETIMNGAGMASPDTLAVYDRKGRGTTDVLLKSRQELENFLSNGDNFPLFAKPTTGLLSIGSFRIDKRTEKGLIINASHTVPVPDVCDYIQGVSKKGYLFQRVLNPHNKISEISGEVIASCRFLVFNFEDKAVVHSCCMKLPGSGEVADNFWRKGSLLCNIDNKSGVITRACLKHENHVEELTNQHELFKKLIGFQLPDFEEATLLVSKAARHFAGIRVQSWDVAFTDKGPLMLEVNYGGDLNLSQLASNEGVMGEQYCALLRQSGYSGKLPS